MDDWNSQLIIFWGVAGVALCWQLYLIVTWPKVSSSRRTASLPAADRQAVEGIEPLSLLDLDGLIVDVEKTESRSGIAAGNAPKRRKAPTTLQQRVIRAGIYNKSGIRRFHVIRLAITLGSFCIGPILATATALPQEFGFLFGAVAALAGYLAPSFWLDHRLRRRQTQMRRALPDALDLVTVCMQGGLSLPAALARVSRELGTAHPMLASELAIVEREVQMGRSTGEAMRQFAQRFDLEELRSLASVVGQAEKFGGSITSALKTYADGLRVKRRQHAEEMAQRAAVKLLFPTILCIFPGIFVVILGPTAIRVYQVIAENPWGS